MPAREAIEHVTVPFSIGAITAEALIAYASTLTPNYKAGEITLRMAIELIVNHYGVQQRAVLLAQRDAAAKAGGEAQA